MDTPTLVAKIATSKFYPPRINISLSLYRRELIENLALKSHRIIAIEAQAGQGKTTLILQYLAHMEAPFAWYQIGPEDADPVFLLSALNRCLQQAIPGFSCSLANYAHMSGEVTLSDLLKMADAVLNALDKSLNNSFSIVFDDLHLLSNCHESSILIQYLLEQSPAQTRIVYASREPLFSGLGNDQRIRFGNEDLMVIEAETSELFTNVLQTQLSRNSLTKIQRLTNGWIMGMILLNHQIASNPEAIDRMDGFSGSELGQDKLLNYLCDEFFIPLAETVQKSLLRLSLLDDIPIELARQITGNEDIGVALEQLVERNGFVRHLDPSGKTYGLHHLFKSFLAQKARQEIESVLIWKIFEHAAAYSRKNHNLAQSLRYYLKAQDFLSIEELLAQSGMVFIVENQAATLASVLAEIPDEILENQGWTALCAVLANMDSEPQQKLYLLDAAIKVFTLQGDSIGELIALSHLLSIHISTTGYCPDAENRLQRAEQMFYQVSDNLSVFIKILVARSLALSYCTLMGDMPKAARFSTLALELAHKHHLVNLQAALMLVKGYEQIFAGNTAQILICMEQAYPYLYRPEVGLFNALAIRVMHFNFLFHNGDFENYFDQKKQLIALFGKDLFSQSIAGCFCYIWEIDIALNRGRIDDAETLTDQLLAKSASGLSPHLQSQALHFKALILALRHKHQAAITTAQESTALRNVARGNYFISLNKILTGLTHAQCGFFEKGLELVSEGIHAARELPTEYLEACGTLHRAYVYLLKGDLLKTGEDLVSGLRLMRKNNYVHFWAWIPDEIHRLLEFAANHRIESVYTGELAMRNGLALAESQSGGGHEAIPLLHIQSLGGLKLYTNRQPIVSSEELTPVQRTVICLLISAPNHKMGQEQIQLLLWPDGSPENARTNFDTMLSRLRKLISNKASPYSAKHYLKLQKGILILEHCNIDVTNFMCLVRRGIEHSQMQEHWQAGNSFFLADRLWLGEFAPEVSGEHQIRNFRNTLFNQLLELTFTWASILKTANRLLDAIAIVEKALKYEPVNAQLVRLLYQLHYDSPESQAQQILRRYEGVLMKENYSKEEIDTLLKFVTDAVAS